MKGKIFAVIFLFFITSCFAQEISFQKELYSPSETIIGQINNAISDVSVANIKIYEGRREVFFDKGVLKENDTIYFYIIPTKEGEFSLQINNVLYNNSNVLSSKNLERKFNITQINSSIGYGIRPGLYEGQNPEFIVTNLKQTKINITLNKTILELNALESRKINIDVFDGFSIYTFGEYKIPIAKFDFIGNGTNIPQNNISLNESSFTNCLSVYVPQLITAEINITQNYSFGVKNNCSKKIEEIIIKQTLEGLILYEKNISLDSNEMLNITFGLTAQTSGESVSNLTLEKQNVQLTFAQIKIYSFENKTNLQTFIQSYSNTTTTLSCAELNGEFCEGNNICSTENLSWDYGVGKPCCLSGCINPNEKETSWINIIVAILGISVIFAIGYLLLKRSKNLGAPKAEEKFKEAEKKYAQKFVSVNKK